VHSATARNRQNKEIEKIVDEKLDNQVAFSHRQDVNHWKQFQNNDKINREINKAVVQN